MVSAVSDNGQVVELNNDSKYFIWPGDSFKCSSWCTNQMILIKETKELTYEYTLTNLDTTGPDIVKAHKV